MLLVRQGVPLVGSVVALLVACGNSASNETNDGDDGGESGSTNGGTSGNGGSGAASGGTAGSAGSSTGGIAGSSGTSGTSSGGASGSAGSGGTAGRGYRPPANQLAGCTRSCELERAAMCSAETTFEKCVEGCHVGILFETCSELWDPVFACVETAQSAMCTEEGEAFIADCVDEATPAFECVMTDGIQDDLALLCSAQCSTAAAAMCPNGGDPEGCEYRCNVIASAFPVCRQRFEVFVACAGAAEHTCNAEGEPEAAGCAAVFGAFVDCLDAEYGWQVDRGIVR